MGMKQKGDKEEKKERERGKEKVRERVSSQKVREG